MRSVATISSSLSLISYVSRTLPRAKSLRGSSVSVKGGPAITTGSPVGIARSRSGYSQTQPLESEVGVFEAGPGVEDLVHARADPLHHLVILLQQRPEARTSALHGFHRGPL